MPERTRILVLTLSFGSGHVRAAETVARELCAHETNANVRVTDALNDSRLLFRAAYVAPYWMMLRHAPSVWRWFFMRRTKTRSDKTAPEWAFRRGCPQVFDEIERWHPRVVVACEVAACEMAAAAKRRGLTDAKLVCVITDHEAEPVWVKPEVDLYAVADERVRESLIAWGADAARVRVCGIPVGREFTEPRDESEIAATHARFQLDASAPVVLLMGGGMGPTRMDEVAAELCRAEVALQIVAVAGYDERARRKLERLRDEHTARASSSPVVLHVVGWTDEIASLMRAAAVLVTKPGGVTTSEAAACALPCVLFDAIPGPEQQNARRFVEAGAAIETRGSRETADATLAIVRDENLRARMSASTSRLARPDAASIIARLALDAARESSPETTVRESSQETSACESSPCAMAGGAEAVARESLRRRTA